MTSTATLNEPFVVFDVDGVLVDTRELVVQAYRDVGVEMPENAWGLPWHEWLPALVGDDGRAAELHREKTRRYVPSSHRSVGDLKYRSP